MELDRGGEADVSTGDDFEKACGAWALQNRAKTAAFGMALAPNRGLNRLETRICQAKKALVSLPKIPQERPRKQTRPGARFESKVIDFPVLWPISEGNRMLTRCFIL